MSQQRALAPAQSILYLAIATLLCPIVACSPRTLPDNPAPIPFETAPKLAHVNSLSEEALLSEWLTMAQDPGAYARDPRPLAICDQLDRLHPTALTPIIQLLGHPETSDPSKIFVLQCITINMALPYLPHLLPLLESQNPTTRSCATTLLGAIDDPAVIAPLLRMKQDSDPRVSFSAWSGLALRGEEPYRQNFVHHYLAPKATHAQRSEIIRVLLKDTRVSDEFIVSSIITTSETPPTVRHLLVMALANIGQLSSLKALQNSIPLDPSDEYRRLVESTIAVIQERSSITQ